MPPVDINYGAVVLAAILHMAIGMAWYSRALFGTIWVKALGKNNKELEAMKKDVGRAYILSFAGALLMAYVLAYLLDLLVVINAAQGTQFGFLLWLGFVVTTGSATVLFEGRPKAFFYINNAYTLISLMAMGGLLAAWS